MQSRSTSGVSGHAMKSLFRFALSVAFLAINANAAETLKPKPQFQYKSDGIEIPIPTADEPKVATFNADTIRAAAKYMDDGAICWVREKTCVNCHTTGPYLGERPALMPLLGKPQEEVLENFINGVPVKVTAQK